MHVFFCVSKNVSVSCAYTQGKREQFSGFNRTLDAINNVFRKFSAFHDETGRLNVDGMNIISNDGSNKLNRSRKARVSYKVQRTINASLRSEERFSRNAETDIVCRLLLEKKNARTCSPSRRARSPGLRFANGWPTPSRPSPISTPDMSTSINEVTTSPHTYPSSFFYNHTSTTKIYTLSLHDALPIYDGSNKLNRSRKARVSYKVQRTINASLNAATSTRAVSSNPNFVTRQKIEIIFG